MKKFVCIIIVLSIALSLFGCNKQIKYNYTYAKYGDLKNQDMSIFLPENITEDVPIILFIHGGGWAAGEMANFYHMCKSYADKGYATVSINYRLSPDGAKCDDMLDDIKSALQYLYDHSAEYHLKTDSTALIGGSAGAHLSLLYGYKVEDSPIPISFIVSLCGPTDLTNIDYKNSGIDIIHLIKEFTGDNSYNFEGQPPASWINASPITYVKATLPYAIIAHGTNDTVVPYSDALRLSEKLSLFQADYDLVTFNHAGHDLLGDNEASIALNLLIDNALNEYLPLN